MACLDTSFLIDLMREQNRRAAGAASEKLDELHIRNEIARTTLFTIGELYAGLSASKNPEKEAQAIEAILLTLEILEFRITTARIFGSLFGQMRRKGFEVGPIDTLIASVVLEHDEILVTRNVRHFSRIPLLRVEAY